MTAPAAMNEDGTAGYASRRHIGVPGISMTAPSTLHANPSGSGCIFFRVGMFEIQTVAGTSAVGIENATHWTQHAVEQHTFYADMVVKVLQMAGSRNRTTHMSVD